MTPRYLITTLAGVALLAACSDEPSADDADNDSRTAEGEVLGGTISDDMLPLDTVRSQAPALSEDSESGENAAASDDAETED